MKFKYKITMLLIQIIFIVFNINFSKALKEKLIEEENFLQKSYNIKLEETSEEKENITLDRVSTIETSENVERNTSNSTSKFSGETTSKQIGKTEIFSDSSTLSGETTSISDIAKSTLNIKQAKSKSLSAGKIFLISIPCIIILTISATTISLYIGKVIQRSINQSSNKLLGYFNKNSLDQFNIQESQSKQPASNKKK